MSKTPIELMLDGIQWTAMAAKGDAPSNDRLPTATHEGVLELGGHRLRCYQLDNGVRVFNEDDFNEFFGGQLLP